jgi:hypothetical protein
MMGLPSLILDGDLATNWRRVLEDNDLTVQPDEPKEGRGDETHVPKRVSEVLWRVGNGSQEVRILQIKYHDRPDGNVYVVFMPSKSRAERQLFLLVRDLLIASGASVGESKKATK